ncbi:hypothetical protein, partial [Enterococcus faecium]|uniref:hypothetical protein n=1 Tax=Enterococcus faecium TaxID=1352 RepID=UPI001C8BAC70
LWLKTLYRKRAVTWPFIFYTIIWTLSSDFLETIKNQKKYSPNSPSSFDFIYIMKSSYENYYFMFRQE